MKKNAIYDQRAISIIVFSLFSAWLLSFVYEGQIFYSLLDSYQLNPGRLMLFAILAHAAGLFICGYIVRDMTTAKKVMMVAAGLCIAGSGVFFFAPSVLWTVCLITMALLAGMWNAAWGWFLRGCSMQNQRMGTVAASIAVGTALMIGLNMAAIYIQPQFGLTLAMLCLAGAFVFAWRLPQTALDVSAGSKPKTYISIRGPLALLCLFIVVMTINSGLMFSVVNPAFAHLTTLTSWYWAVPYIAALAVFAQLPRKVKRSYILYAAIAMQGFGFIAFLLLDRSAGSYLAVNTLLLGAFGVNDLFWWSILGEMLDLHKNPAKLLGLGLSVNVAGVLLGELVSSLLSSGTNGNAPTLTGLAVVCAALVILPVLYNRLTLLLKSSSFLTEVAEMPPAEQVRAIETVLHTVGLTERENQIAALLLKGYTYRLITQELFISESTVRTHIQNIYFKLGIHNKTELIQRLSK